MCAYNYEQKVQAPLLSYSVFLVYGVGSEGIYE